MKVLLHIWSAAPSLLSRYGYVADQLRASGHDVDLVLSVEPAALMVADYGMVFSHFTLPDALRTQLPGKCFGARQLTRGEQLNLLAGFGFPTMEWMLVGDKASALDLFATWGVDKLIVKESFTSSGKGFHVFTPNQARVGDWDLSQDVICKEVNPNDGNTYKAELFNGRVLISFVLKKQPLSARLLAGSLDAAGFRQLAVYRDELERPDERHRELFEFPDADQAALEKLSRQLTDAGFGYVVVDLMRKPDGSFVAIELNLSGVTTWWTEQWAQVRQRLADGMVELAQSLQ